MSLLPETLHQPYLDLQQHLVAMQAMVSQDRLAITENSASLPISDLQNSFQAAQQHFQQHILTPSTALELDAHLQSIQTEINRHLRLLSTDLAFLRSSRQPNTQQQRLQQVSDRLTHLLDFCQGILTA